MSARTSSHQLMLALIRSYLKIPVVYDLDFSYNLSVDLLLLQGPMNLFALKKIDLTSLS